MADQEDPPDEGVLSEEELHHLIRAKTMDALREIDALIQQYRNSGLSEEPGDPVVGSKQKLYLRWKKDRGGEEE